MLYHSPLKMYNSLLVFLVQSEICATITTVGMHHTFQSVFKKTIPFTYHPPCQPAWLPLTHFLLYEFVVSDISLTESYSMSPIIQLLALGMF